MKYRSTLILGIVACFALALYMPPADAYSDPIGIFARIDKVVLEPATGAPERIQIWGAFSIASKQGGTYEPVQRGYLYYSAKPGKEEVCRKEWNDLKAIAGTDQIVGIGRRYEPIRLRKATDKPTDPDVYPVGSGLAKVGAGNTDYPPIRDLKAFPRGH